MKIPAILAVAATAALTLSACGAAAPPPRPGRGARRSTSRRRSGLHVATTSLGRVLVDASGRTVYMLTADAPRHCRRARRRACSSGPPWRPGATRATVTAKVGSTADPGRADDRDGRRAAGLHVRRRTSSRATSTARALQEFGGTWYAVSATGAAVQPVVVGSHQSAPVRRARRRRTGGGY